MTDEQPKIELTHKRAVCARHGEPFRERWPTGFPIMLIRLFENLFGTKASGPGIDLMWVEARKILSLPADADPGIPGMHALFDAKPMCCRVPPGVLEKLYEECGVGVRGRCVVCRRKRLGTVYRTMQGKLDHLCFNCVVRAQFDNRN